jgi:hypothetical protein
MMVGPTMPAPDIFKAGSRLADARTLVLPLSEIEKWLSIQNHAPPNEKKLTR